MHKLSLSLLLVIVVAIFGFGYLLDAIFERYEDKNTDSVVDITALGNGLADALERSENPGAIVSQWPSMEKYRIDLIELNELVVPTPLQAEFLSGKPLALESEQGLSLHYRLNSHDKVLTLNSNLATNNDKQNLSWVFTSLFYLCTLTAVLLWLYPLLKRLQVLRRSTNAFGAGKLESRVNIKGSSYIQDIENDFNHMADQIQQLIEDNKLLTSAVSHDLRTPLTRLRLGIDTLTESASFAGPDQYTQRIKHDLNEMETLVDSLLQFARLDNVMDGMEKTLIDLYQLLEQCTSQFYDTHLDIQLVRIGVELEDTLTTRGCIEHIATLFNNVLQNASKHAKSRIIIEVQSQPDAIQVAIRDDGPGIPIDQREQIMKPFVRGSINPGYGLGLAVALRIANHHKAHLSIEDCEQLGGVKMCIRILRA